MKNQKKQTYFKWKLYQNDEKTYVGCWVHNDILFGLKNYCTMKQEATFFWYFQHLTRKKDKSEFAVKSWKVQSHRTNLVTKAVDSFSLDPSSDKAKITPEEKKEKQEKISYENNYNGDMNQQIKVYQLVRQNLEERKLLNTVKGHLEWLIVIH